MSTPTEENRKIRVFKKPRGRKWSAELRFADGTKQVIQTRFEKPNEEKAALMSATHKWTDVSREKGLIPSRKEAFAKGRANRNAKAKVGMNGHSATNGEAHHTKPFGRDKPKGHALKWRGEALTEALGPGSRLQRRCQALLAIAAAMEDLDPSDISWVMSAVAEAEQSRVGAAEMAKLETAEAKRKDN